VAEKTAVEIGDTELHRPGLLRRANRWGKLGVWDILLAVGPSLMDSRSRYIVTSNLTIDLYRPVGPCTLTLLLARS